MLHIRAIRVNMHRQTKACKAAMGDCFLFSFLREEFRYFLTYAMELEPYFSYTVDIILYRVFFCANTWYI